MDHCFDRGERAWSNLRLHSFLWQRLGFLDAASGAGKWEAGLEQDWATVTL